MTIGELQGGALQDLLAEMQENNEGIAETEEIGQETADEEHECPTDRKGRALSVNVVSVVAYLIGVPEEHFGKSYKKSIFTDLQKNDGARTIRSLCTIRNAIMQKPGTIYEAMRLGMHNLDSIPEHIDPELFTYLNTQKCQIVRGAQLKSLTEYISVINGHISNKLYQCSGLLPSWVKWDYIKDIILMPNGTKDEKIQSAMDRLKENINSYPFACYINWPLGRTEAFVEDPQNYLEPMLTGNVLLHDRRFLVLLYRNHGDEFFEFDHVYDANKETKKGLFDFISTHDSITMLVDCENSDPYKLCAMMESLKETCYSHMEEDADVSLKSIRKIILFDDYHTIDAWDVLKDYTGIPIEHEEVERVLGHKSLIDIAMTVGACKEHMCNGVDAFLLASSDSDFWGLMRAMPDASFMVLAEDSKFSPETKRFYDEHGIANCVIDDFAGNLNKIKETALYRGLEKHLNNTMYLNLFDALEDVYPALGLEGSEQEKANMRASLAKRLQLTVDAIGDISIRIA